MNKNILLKYNASIETFKKGEFIFQKGDIPHYFYQILKGRIKVFSFNEKGKEFTHKIFNAGEGFGIPPLFLDIGYPANAEVISNVELLRLSKCDFMRMLEENPKYYKTIIKSISRVLLYKSVMSSEISMNSPEQRIIALFKQLKTIDEPEIIHLTRQQIANLTALRVETVIRHIKCLEEQGILTIKDRKVIY